MDEDPGRQARWQELTRSECFALLAREHLGRVAVADDRWPDRRRHHDRPHRRSHNA